LKWLVDAQLPMRLAVHLRQCGEDVIHTLEMPHGNRTADKEIATTADIEDRVVISKDSDFVDSLIIRRIPRKLLHVTTGNIANDKLVDLFHIHLPAIKAAFGESDLVELHATGLVVHQ